jgi:protein-S-isoprenylcysteine O-methyltransferase Ste14
LSIGDIFFNMRVRAVLGSVLFLIVAARNCRRPSRLVDLQMEGSTGIPWLFDRSAAWVLILAVSVLVLLEAFARFALQGIGTPAPVLPTRHLVVSGFYRYVRNPMCVAVVGAILGQSMILGNLMLLSYAALDWLVSHLFVVTYEEPTLRKAFGDEYGAFCANVPRWIPRLRPWTGPVGPGG